MKEISQFLAVTAALSMMSLGDASASYDEILKDSNRGRNMQGRKSTNVMKQKRQSAKRKSVLNYKKRIK